MGKAFRPYSSRAGERGFTWLCPGCGELHAIPVKGNPRTNWKWNGDTEAPTFSPSVLVHPHAALDEGGAVYQTARCHFFIRGGIADFCGDCTHEHAGEKLVVLARVLDG